MLVGTFLGDTGAYLGGRMFGGARSRRRSRRTRRVEGLVIGMFAAVAAAFFAGLYQDWLTRAPTR